MKIKNKADLLSSFESIHGRKASSKEEEGEYATELWSFLTDLKKFRRNKDLYIEMKRTKDKDSIQWVFDNAIVTDGTSISFQVTDKKTFGRKTLHKKSEDSDEKKESRKKKDKKKDEIVPTIDLKSVKVLGCDPGKKDILCLTDGFRIIRYTRGQRQQDTLLKTRVKETLYRRKKANIEKYETTVLNQSCKKSCLLETFFAYAKARKVKEEELFSVYSKPVFRQFKFLSYCKAKSSEDKFADHISKFFKKPSTQTMSCVAKEMIDNNKRLDSRKDYLIAWGNWGKNPNLLKGSAPTPGVGIRSRFERYFKTTTINEYMTSQTCPCCRNIQCLKKEKINDIERHHLLRCNNDSCTSRWWNRNVVGSFNILDKAFKSFLLKEPEGEQRFA